MIVCTEVIERLPTRNDQVAFMEALTQLVKPNGQVIITTPRGELFERWMRLKTKANQPVENWLTKAELIDLTSNSGLKMVYHEPFGWHGFVMRSSLITRILQRLMRMIGYVGLLPQGLMTYQLLQLRK